jgi:hypothetical protein
MCNPLAIGLMVAGTALQVNAQRKRQANMEDAAEDARALEASRQDKMREERESVLVDSQQGMGLDAQNAALAEAQAKREAAYAPENVPNSSASGSYSGVATDSGTPKIVMEDVEKKRAQANTDVASVGDARARLGAYGDVTLGNRINNSNTGNTLGMLGGFARGSANLLPGEVQAAMAKHAGDRKGQELLGTALSMYGGFGAPGAGAAGAGSFAGYGSAMGGSANAGATVGGYSGNLSSFAPVAGAAGQAGADAAAPSLMGGLFSNATGSTLPWWQQAGQAGRGTASGIGSLLASRR